MRPDATSPLPAQNAPSRINQGPEQLRDFFGRHPIGLILIGIPGVEKRVARYPQLYSHIGFAHHDRPLTADELHFVLTHHWEKLVIGA
jgi:hypothetical protein